MPNNDIPDNKMDVHHINEMDAQVHLHLSISGRARRALRLAAASRGWSMATLVSHWAEAEARSLGLTVTGTKKKEVRDGR